MFFFVLDFNYCNLFHIFASVEFGSETLLLNIKDSVPLIFLNSNNYG